MNHQSWTFTLPILNSVSSSSQPEPTWPVWKLPSRLNMEVTLQSAAQGSEAVWRRWWRGEGAVADLIFPTHDLRQTPAQRGSGRTLCRRLWLCVRTEPREEITPCPALLQLQLQQRSQREATEGFAPPDSPGLHDCFIPHFLPQYQLSRLKRDSNVSAYLC